MPKGAELHCHYSSLIDYDYLIEDIIEVWEGGKNKEFLKFGTESYKGNESIVLFL